jgi:membrane protease YdiL (CAAX protease family)
MTRSLSDSRRAAWVLLVACCVLVSCAWSAPVWASPDDEPPPPEETADEAGEDTADAEALEERLLSKPHTAATTLILRFAPALVGVMLLILWYLKRDKIKGGMLPAPAPVTPTRPFGVWPSIGLTLLAMAAIPIGVMVFLMLVFNWQAEGDVPIWAAVLVSAAGSLPVAAVVLVRRRALAAATPEAPVPPPAMPPPLPSDHADPVSYPEPDRGAPGTPAPGPKRAFGLAWWALCVAAPIVFLVSVIWAVVMDGFDLKPVTQEIVQQVADPEGPPVDAWIIAVFGVLVAPFVEETIFRGMLYPAAKRAFGGGRRGMWAGAVVVSLIFAAIHWNWYALLPLFALAMVLTWVFETTNSLAAVILAHALHNLFSMVPLFLLRFVP